MDANLKKLKEIRQAMNAKFYEREREVEGILLALLAKQHMLMIGPAGTAKSALSSELSQIIEGTNYFQWLLTRFSTPEEVFGPLSLKELEEGVYKRNTETKMPEAHIVFLDEIFKANSAILNSLLTLINERLFYNDGAPVEVPLMSVIGASNEYPEDGEGLEALFDRFLLRYEIDFIQDERNFFSMLKEEGQPEKMPSMHVEELKLLQAMTDQVAIPDEIYEALAEIRRELQDEGIRPSDRRFKQLLCVLRARALLHQRERVEMEDLTILENALWETLDQKNIVMQVVRSRAGGSQGRSVASIRKEAEEVYDAAVRDQSAEAGMEATEKLSALEKELAAQKENNPEGVQELMGQLDMMKKEIESSRLESDYAPGAQEEQRNDDEPDSAFFRM